MVKKKERERMRDGDREIGQDIAGEEQRTGRRMGRRERGEEEW